MDILVIFSFFFSFILCYLLVPPVRRISLAMGFTDEPDHRKQHIHPISRVGGIAISIAFFLATLTAYFVLRESLPVASNTPYLLSLISIFAFFALGLFEDFFETSPFIRLFVQVLISLFIYSNGILIDFIEFSFSPSINNFYLELPNLISILITILWIVGVTNAFNWIDGVDGLAAGVAFISFLNLMLINLSNNDFSTAILAASLSGACLGFIPENSFPAKLHMGDSGSYLLGISLSILTLITFSNLYIADGVEINKINILLCFLSVAMPVCDMVFVIFNRLKSNLSPFFPDRRHFHHRLLDIGFNSDETILIIFMIVLFMYSLVYVLTGNFILSLLNFIFGSFFILLKYQTIRNK
tara:strand:- start:4169 stop:5236 length:1068 start_codon:yes stop_codon:yes gene_type:complete